MQQFDKYTRRALFMAFFCIFVVFWTKCAAQTFPQNTDFEISLGDWYQSSSDDFDWSLKNGASTPSNGTGPQIAPYGGNGSSGYLFSESSSPRTNGEIARIFQTIDLSQANSASMKFFYHSYAANGYGPGTLRVKIYYGNSYSGGSMITAFTNSTSSTLWRTATIDMNAYVGYSVVQIQIESIMPSAGTCWQSDNSIDEIVIEANSTPPPTVTVDVFPYNQGFDTEVNSSTSCCSPVTIAAQGWENDDKGNDDCDWKARDVGTVSLNTGPSGDQSGTGSYLYMEASGCYSKTAYLISPKMDFTAETGPFVQFYYHMYGSSIDKMEFDWSLDKTTWFNVWAQSGDQGNQWKIAMVDLSYLAGQEAYVRLKGTTGSNYMSDMAFDGFQMFGSGTPLPIDLVSFGADVNENLDGVIINWTVASQVNNDYYSIERSTDVESWESIGTMPGAGSNNEMMSYVYYDEQPLDGVSYYRLRQTDYDGKTEAFYPVSVQIIRQPLEVVKRYNLMGQIVTESYNGIVIEQYTDGSIAKKYYDNWK